MNFISAGSLEEPVYKVAFICVGVLAVKAKLAVVAKLEEFELFAKAANVEKL
jgi:hypothetical protein